MQTFHQILPDMTAKSEYGTMETLMSLSKNCLTHGLILLSMDRPIG